MHLITYNPILLHILLKLFAIITLKQSTHYVVGKVTLKFLSLL